jgi:hypothetical protein
MFVVLALFLVCLLTYAIYRLPFFALEASPRWVTPLFFLAKLFFGFTLWAVYTFYYTDRSTSDIYKFYDDAQYLHQAWIEQPTSFMSLMQGKEDSSLNLYTSQMKNWERNFNHSVPFNENRFMIKLNAFMLFISGGNIHIHTILFCLLSFVGCVLLLQVFQHFLPEEKKKWAILTFVFPSFLFWTSGGLKESVIILGLGLLLWGFVFVKDRGILSLFAIAFGVLLLLFTKYFLFLCLVPALAVYHILSQRKDVRSNLYKYASSLIVLALLVVALAPIDKRLDFARIVAKKQKHAVAEALYMNAGSYSPVPTVEANLPSIAAGLPVGLWNSLLKPYLWQSRNPMMLMSGAENVLFLLLVVLALVYRDKRATIDYNLIFFLLCSVVLYFSLIGLMTPVIGNLVRYRVVLEPLLIFALIAVTDTSAITNRLFRKRA